MREIINALLGRHHAGEVIVVTDRGVELPIGRAHPDWTMLQLTRLLAQIDRLPETDHPLDQWEGLAG